MTGSALPAASRTWSRLALRVVELVLLAACVLVGLEVYAVLDDGTYLVADALRTDGEAFDKVFDRAIPWLLFALAPLYAVTLAIVRWQMGGTEHKRAAAGVFWRVVIPYVPIVSLGPTVEELLTQLAGADTAKRAYAVAIAAPILCIAGLLLSTIVAGSLIDDDRDLAVHATLIVAEVSCVGPLLLRIWLFRIVRVALPLDVDDDDPRASAVQPVAG